MEGDFSRVDLPGEVVLKTVFPVRNEALGLPWTRHEGLFWVRLGEPPVISRPLEPDLFRGFVTCIEPWEFILARLFMGFTGFWVFVHSILGSSR